ncbi:orotidine-5'-phosphate decarboxylase [Aestuariibacter salexigens]|uniref:orotidine-5'-phosphate decarboxylase n=1 Tax=Aestuariibacter salexigens TaxID=226010 RepID=UPI000404181E|nr:orotidine-5'-phosphate decarboxylase [Aestuariibacter salexigens]
MSVNDPHVIVALDFDNQNDAMALVNQLSVDACKLKVGKEMFTLFGPSFVETLVDRGFDVFLDLKFHDIPNTVAKACQAAAKLGVWMVNVHASGGVEMMQRAKEALMSSQSQRAPLLTAVTVLTSMNDEQLKATGVPHSAEQHVLHLAKLAQQSGVDGVVCSAREAQLLRQQCGQEFLLVTPGIRPEGAALGDQKRVMTPQQAIEAGVNYMVIGRPITQSAHPTQTLVEINRSIQK